MPNWKLPNYAFSLPWFMYDVSNNQLITSQTVPSDISSKKDVYLSETPIPGLNFSPIQPSGNGNTKISFTLPLIKRNNTIGNSLLLQQLHGLRNQATGLKSMFSQQFNPNPKVLYFWGTGSLPLIYYVKKADFTNKQGWTNQLGQPQFSEVEFELWLDENHALYKAEELYRKVSIYTATALYSIDNTAKPFKERIF
jgi:acyl-CoA synthetase (AMP-forming)/AMP-acid ligase II